MYDKSKIVVLIPSYEPDIKLVDLIENLTDKHFPNILVINDGSSEYSYRFFEELESFKNVEVINHIVNQGKGRALKTGFKHVLDFYPNVLGCITVDADGQHLPEDIEECLNVFMNDSHDLVLGVRNFDEHSIPLRSKVGNKMSVQMMKLFTGINIGDTQTGLRVLTRATMDKFLEVPGERYEFEMNALVETKKLGIEITQVPIHTVYIDNNETSHFNPIRDSFKIYKVFFKYTISSIISSIVDILFFGLFVNIFAHYIPAYYILISTLLARIISVLVNYGINSRRVFQKSNQRKKAFYKYISLAFIQALASAFLVTISKNIFIWDEVWVKILVDIGLFFISFIIQREFVFAEKEKNHSYESY